MAQHIRLTARGAKLAIIPALLAFALGGCGLFDSGIEWESGPYALMWIDDRDNVSLSYKLGPDSWAGRIGPQVFAVGADDRYIVAKQHPDKDRAHVNYFIVVRSEDGPNALTARVVVGPLTESEFEHKARLLNLPPFSKVLESLQ